MVFFSAVICSGCGSARVSNSLNTVCPSDKQAAPARDVRSNLTSTVPASDTAGLGFLDIISSDASGNPVSKRCTVSLWPREGTRFEVDADTSGHCFFEWDSSEFKNARFVIQVAFNGGYFPVKARMPIQETLGSFSRSLTPFSANLPEDLRERLNEATRTDAMIDSCKTGTDAFAAQLGSDRKTIACFGKNESRSVHFVLEPEESSAVWLERVLEAKRELATKAFALLPGREQKIIRLRLEGRRYESVLDRNLKQFAYILNETHCSTAKSVMNDLGFVNQTKTLCSSRDPILAALPGILKEKYPLVQNIVEAKNLSLEELKTLNHKLFLDRFATLADLNPDVITSLKTVTEHELLGRQIWDLWVAPGPEKLMSIFQLDTQKIAQSGSVFLSIKSNALPSAAALASEDVSQSRPRRFEISDAGAQMSPAALNGQAIMLNFDPKKSQLFLMQKDSGSTLNFLDIFPLATLTTLDGEPTSGGAGVLPLPPVSDEQDEANCN